MNHHAISTNLLTQQLAFDLMLQPLKLIQLTGLVVVSICKHSLPSMSNLTASLFRKNTFKRLFLTLLQLYNIIAGTVPVKFADTEGRRECGTS